MSDTPRTDAAEAKFGDGAAMHAYCHDESHLSGDFADFARTLERELAAVTAERDALRAAFERDKNNDSDSPVGQCSCLTKSPDIRYHKKGCRYRLIMERDRMREALERQALHTPSYLCAEAQIALGKDGNQ